jgi:hypothetical protein
MPAWLRRFLRKAKRYWWWWLVMLISALLQDRIVSATNKWIDDNSTPALQAIAAFLNWTNDHSLGIVGLFLAGTFIVLMIAALLEGRGSPPEFETSTAIWALTSELRRERGSRVVREMLEDIKRAAGAYDPLSEVQQSEPPRKPQGPIYEKLSNVRLQAIIERHGLIYAREAAIKLYRELPHKFLLARAKERIEVVQESDSPEDILNWVAAYMASRIPVYGMTQPTHEPKKIVSSEMRLLRFADGATVLKHLFYPASDPYTLVYFKADEF